MGKSSLYQDFGSKAVAYIIFPTIWIKLVLSFSINAKHGASDAARFYAGTDILLFLLIVVVLVFTPFSKMSFSVISVVSILFALNLLTWAINNTPFIDQNRLVLKIITPILFYLALQKFAYDYPRQLKLLTTFTLVVICFCTIYGFLFFESSYNRLDRWMPAYFSGLHTTAYVWLGVIFSIFAMLKKERSLFFYWLLSFGFISVLWGVRTSQLALIVFVFMHYLNQYKITNIRFKLSVFGTILFVSILVYSSLNPHFQRSLDYFSSGRISMYSTKISLIYRSDLISFLFGGGFGKDLIVSKIWWWGAKGAHNDYLTIIIEQGIFFLLVTIILLFILFKRSENQSAKSIILIYIITSSVSNGIMVRPLPAYILFLAACTYISVQMEYDRKNKIDCMKI